MQVRPLSISGAVAFTPKQHRDPRGAFCEWFKADVVEAAVGHRLRLEQANLSISGRGTLRGVHFAQVPPSQAKYVACPRGTVLDMVVDIRVGSPTFGAVEGVILDDDSRTALYLAEGLGHAFLALTDDATVTYLCSAPYAPGREFGINPLDPALGLTGLPDWPDDIKPLLSDKDGAAPTLKDAAAQGLLPTYDECQAFYATLRS